MRLRTTSQEGLQHSGYVKDGVTQPPSLEALKQPQASFEGHVPLFHVQGGRAEKDERSLLTGRSQVEKKKEKQKAEHVHLFLPNL